MHKAKKALLKAESVFAQEADSSRTRAYSYVATRKAQWALSQAKQAALETRAKILADKETELARSGLNSAKQALSEREDRLEDVKRELGKAEREAAAAEQQRASMAAQLSEVRGKLEAFSSILEGERGLVITLSSGILFATGESELLAEGQHKLTRVARYLNQTDAERTILIEGHTDDRGGSGFNLTLSRERAEAVKQHLLLLGVDEQRMRAVGVGESRPVATNDTVEGRANNRRVEIIVETPNPK